MNCKSCNIEVISKFCPNCGQKAQLERINGHYIKYEIQHLFHFEKGFFYTIRELLLRPGQSVRTFLTENRSKYMKPITFIIVTSLIYTLVNQYFNIDGQYENLKLQKTEIIQKWMQDHVGYSNILLGVLIAFFVKLFFRKYNYNFYEILILLCYIMGVGMLIFTVFALLQELIHFDLLGISSFSVIAYTTFAIADFFERTKPANYVKILFAYILGSLLFSILVVFFKIFI
ncbi:DUF3667 domain-containing protein [Myroides sp. C15-4]|uniref:DUF3667 domain-containing protein n=1 Tax=Myroides sp. C15-4 TaxID=3400532 RepID=UPI003D2F881E